MNSELFESDPVESPFPGLRPFDLDESHLFFGREGQVASLIGKLERTRFVAVIAPSGSGKSSLVRAGLLPALHGGSLARALDWRVAFLRPGIDPIGNLARALSQTGALGDPDNESDAQQVAVIETSLRRGSLGLVEIAQQKLRLKESLLIVTDQFEEMFRVERAGDGDRLADEQAAFVKLLLAAAQQQQAPVYVVLVTRTDYLGECTRFWGLPEAINEGQYLIPRLTREQLRLVIGGPLAVFGASITPRLLNRLLNEVSDHVDQLSILQHALMRTWDAWRRRAQAGGPLDLEHYEEIGAIHAALSRHAEESFACLPDDRSRHVAELLFKCLTEGRLESRVLRRPVTLDEICAVAEASLDEVCNVVEIFRAPGRSFLMPPVGVPLAPNLLIDISHESLIRNWERLRRWVEAEALSARMYSRLAETAKLYREGSAGLWGEPDLTMALNWREHQRPNEAWARRYHEGFGFAMEFLDASRRQSILQGEELARVRALSQGQEKLRRQLVVARAFSVAFALLTVLLGLAAWYGNR